MGLYEKLRAEYGPVAPVRVPGDLPAWLVLGYRENLKVLQKPTVFSRDSRLWRFLKDGSVPPDSPLMPMVGWQPICLFADGDEHARTRGALTAALEKYRGRGVRSVVTRVSHALVDEFASDGVADLVTQFAERAPMETMTHLLGMDDASGPARLAGAARDLMKGTSTAFESNQFLTDELRRLVQHRSDIPGSGLASWLLQHEAGLSEDEVLEHLRLVLVAANETTVNVIAETLRVVLTDERFRARLNGGSMTLPDAIEQVLWDAPPLTAIPGRFTTAETELGDQVIGAGEMVITGLAAGNRDPRIRPDLKAPLNGNRSHLAFGSGPHECPGRDIGRAIAETAIYTLLERLPDIRLVPGVDLASSGAWLSQHLVQLPVEFAKRRPEARTEEQPVQVKPRPAPATPPRDSALPADAAPRSRARFRRSKRGLG